MALTLQRLAKTVDADVSLDNEALSAAMNEAKELVEKMLTGSTAPPAIRERAELEAAADLYRRSLASKGTQAFTEDYGAPTPFPILRDPKSSARVILQPWLTPAIG